MVNENEQIEVLANYAHSAWSGWMLYMFNKSIRHDNGSVTIARELVDRWTRQINTKYKDLPENERESDRKEAREILSLIKKD